MPENLQGQFEKRLYLNTRIKSGGSYTTEGPHGLAFVEELNNYVTENQNTSITLGSSDHKVSILFDGPSTFVRDGIGIDSSVPRITSDRLYNSNGNLYWNGAKLSYAFDYITEDAGGAYIGKFDDTDYCAYVDIKADEVKIKADDVKINGSTLLVGPNFIKSNANQIYFGQEEVQATSVIFSGPVTFNGNGVTLNGTVAINGPIRSGVHLDNNIPSVTSYKLYNNNGDLYWNGGNLSHTFNFINEAVNDLYLGKFNDTDNCEYVSIMADEVRINDSTLVAGPNNVTFNGTTAFNGPIRYGLFLEDSTPSVTSYRLYNNNGVLYWNGTKLNGGGSSYDHIVEHPGWLYLGWNGVTGTEINRIQTWGKKVDTYFNSLTYDGPSVSFENIQHFNINGYGHSNLVIGPKGIRIASNDSIIINGPYSTQISLGVNGIHLGDELNPCTTTIEGPSYFNNTLELRSLSSHPSNRDSKLYNNNGDLCWNGTVVVAGPSNVSFNANEVKINLSAIVTGPNGLSLNGDEVNINGTSIVAGPDYVSFNANEVKINLSAIVTGPNGLSLNGDEVNINGTSIVAGPDYVSLNADHVKINGTAFVAGPSDVRFYVSSFIVEPNFIKFGQEGLQGTTVIFSGPVTFNSTVAINGPISSGLFLASNTPSVTSYKLYNNNGVLYWNGSKVGGSSYEHIVEDSDVLYLGWNGDTGTEIDSIETRGNCVETRFNSFIFNGPEVLFKNIQTFAITSDSGHTNFVIGPNSIAINGPNESQIRIADYGISIKTNKNDYEATIFIQGPGNSSILMNNDGMYLSDSYVFIGPSETQINNKYVQFGFGDLQTSVIFNGPALMYDLLSFDNLSGSPQNKSNGGNLGSYKDDLYWNESKVTNSIINVPYQDVVDEPGKRGSSLSLENNTIYNFDPDHDVDISEINVKPWNTPQLHLYFNNTSSGKSKMTFTYPSEWKWINQSTPPSDNDFKEGYLYCIALRSVANPVYSQSSTTPPYNQQYIVIANIAYEVPVDV